VCVTVAHILLFQILKTNGFLNYDPFFYTFLPNEQLDIVENKT
jgi:hypothetical protein